MPQVILTLCIYLLVAIVPASASLRLASEQTGAVWVPPVNETYGFDATGNRQSSALWDYGWDGRNKLVRARTKNHAAAVRGYDITFGYDSEGRRFRKNVKVYQNGVLVSQDRITFIWDGWDLIYELHQNPSGLTTLERKYVWGPDIAGGTGGDSGAGGAGGLLVMRETRGTQTKDYYPLYDGSGHVTGLTTIIDNVATLVAEYAYGPFGELIHAKGPMAQINPIRYATKYYDAETGLYYYGARYFDPITGQWLSREPLGESASVNLYLYCHNDPINNIDVLGLFEHEWYEGGWVRTLAENFSGYWLDRGINLAISVPQTGLVATGLVHKAMGSGGINDASNAHLESLKNPYGRQGYYSMTSVSDFVAMNLSDIGMGFLLGSVKLSTISGTLAAESNAAALATEANLGRQTLANTRQTFSVGEIMPNGQVAGMGPGAAFKSEFTQAAKGEFTTLYHGTSTEATAAIRANGIDLSFSRANLDFGKGFYTTTDLSQAQAWAARQGGEVLTFNVPNSQLSQLSHFQLPSANGAWADFVGANRGGASLHGFDAVSGPILGNPHAFMNGASPTAFGQQMSFHSDAAINLLNNSLLP